MTATEIMYKICEEETAKAYPELIGIISKRIKEEIGPDAELKPFKDGLPYSLTSGFKSIGPGLVDPKTNRHLIVLPIGFIEFRAEKPLTE